MDVKLNKRIKTVGIIFAIVTFFSIIVSIPFPEIYIAITKKGYFNVQKIKGVEVAGIAKGSPADLIGLQVGDTINTVDNQEINSSGDYVTFISSHKGKSINLEIKRNNNFLKYTITPRLNYPANEGPTGLTITDNKLTTTDINIYQRLTDSIIKPYLGYESLPRSSPIGLYATMQIASSKYYSYHYTGNFDYLLRLMFSIGLFVTTFGIFKRKKYGVYSVLAVGIYTLISIINQLFNLTKIQHLNYVYAIFLIWDIFFLYLCFFIFSKRKVFN